MADALKNAVGAGVQAIGGPVVGAAWMIAEQIEASTEIRAAAKLGGRAIIAAILKWYRLFRHNQTDVGVARMAEIMQLFVDQAGHPKVPRPHAVGHPGGRFAAAQQVPAIHHGHEQHAPPAEIDGSKHAAQRVTRKWALEHPDEMRQRHLGKLRAIRQRQELGEGGNIPAGILNVPRR